MTILELCVLALAGFGAGVVNTIAGGGTFLTFPALVWAGVPPVVANATSAVSVFPGYLGGAFVAKAIPASVVRWIVVVIGYGMSAVFLARLFVS